MKTKEEIEELGFLKYPRFITDPYNPMEDDNTYERKIWIDAYTQCQEDNADKKYTEEDIYKAIDFGRCHSSMTDRDFINSLNKQD